MKRILIATSITLAASTALAAKTGNRSFDQLDANSDGFLSKAELAGNKEMSKRFEKFDANKDGKWNVDEFVKANKDNDERVLADSAITTKVKTALLTEKGLPSTSISVDTYESHVMLSGFV
ncbi:MAG: BON domain-containing protein, partial [Burkholderiales bacterium]